MPGPPQTVRYLRLQQCLEPPGSGSCSGSRSPRSASAGHQAVHHLLHVGVLHHLGGGVHHGRVVQHRLQVQTRHVGELAEASGHAGQTDPAASWQAQWSGQQGSQGREVTEERQILRDTEAKQQDPADLFHPLYNQARTQRKRVNEIKR